MPANIEIKAYARDFDEIRRRAEKISDTSCEVIPQEDTFFNVPSASADRQERLKLREFSAQRGQLIYYQRPNQDGSKRSDYEIFETDNPSKLKSVLSAAYGERGVVKKTRYLYLVGQTRVHLDDVEGLGKFMELEVVMRDGQSDAEGQMIAEDLMDKLGVSVNDLIDGAYMDMFEKGLS
jgi:predicted adenylyl cyclase CyaB